MRRTNTDYKFNDERSNIDYLSTSSLKSSHSNGVTMQSNVNYLFPHPFHMSVANGNICNKHSCLSNICNKQTCLGTIESGIGSSISSIDMHWLTNGNHCSSINSNESEPVMINTGHTKYDCHDLAPVSEEDDTDCLMGVLNKVGETNTHLDQLPWRDLEGKTAVVRNNSEDLSSQLEELSLYDDRHKFSKNNSEDCVKFLSSIFDHDHLNCPINSYQGLNISNDPLTISSNAEDCIAHLEQPWVADTQCPILSSACHDLDTSVRKSDICQNHLACVNSNSDVFYRRQSFQNSSCNIKSINVCENRANIFDEDNNEDHIQLRATERVVEWLKLMIDDDVIQNENKHLVDVDRTFYRFNDDD